MNQLGSVSRFTCLVISRQTGGLLLSEQHEADGDTLDLEALAKLLAALHRFAADRATPEAPATLQLCSRQVLLAPSEHFMVALVLEEQHETQIGEDAKIRAAIIRDVLHRRYGELIVSMVAQDLQRVNRLIETDTAAQQLAYNQQVRGPAGLSS